MKNRALAVCVGLLREMLEYWKLQKAAPLYGYRVFNPALYEECKKIVARLQSEGLLKTWTHSLQIRATKISGSWRNQSANALKRTSPSKLWTDCIPFVIKYVRELSKHGIAFKKETPLHSLFGLYVKFLQQHKLVESEMSERILKSSISVLDAFNTVRNNQSFAHDNPILNHNESVLIFNDISNTVRFVESIERKIVEQKKPTAKEEIAWKDIEFSDEEVEAAGDLWMQLEADKARGK